MDLGLQRLPWYGQVGAFFTVSLLGFLAFYFYWVVPQQNDMVIQQQELDQKRLDIARAQQTASQLEGFEAEVDGLGTRLDSLRAVLPEQKDASDLLRRLQTLASQSNLSIRAFTPQATSVRELHSEWPIQLQFNGTYHNLAMFFDRVSKFSRIINVSNVSVRAIDPPLLNTTITATCTATTFVLNESVPPVADPPPAT